MTNPMTNPMPGLLSPLELELPFIAKIKSHEKTRTELNGFQKCYVVNLSFRNVTVEVHIYEFDPRYQTIEEHLKAKGYQETIQ